jgi:hypothetical protein
MSLSDVGTMASAIFAGISALIAAAAIYFPWRLQHNQELLNQAVLSLERAYAALSVGGTSVRPPTADRLNWLTCARHIQSYKTLKARLKTELHHSLAEEHEEFWRHQFYLCLDIPNIHHASYYAEHVPTGHAGIEPRSALIIYAFASWPEGKPDPIDAVDVQQLLRESLPFQGNHGLREYINSFAQFRNET